MGEAVDQTDMTTGQVRALECLSEGAELLSGSYWLLVAVCGVGTILGGLAPMGILMGPMMCGIYLCYFRLIDGHSVRFELLFQGFDHFIQALIASLILFAVSLIVMTPAVLLALAAGVVSVAGVEHPGAAGLAPAALLLLVAFLLVGLALAVGPFFLFVYPLIVDRGLDAVPAIKASFRAVAANLWGVSLVLLLTGALWLVAALLCYLPVFLVAPLCFATLASAYRRIFPARRALAS